MLRNTLILSTVIYGMRTKELPRNLLNQLETYMYKHIRTMMNPRWKDEEWYQEKKQLYKKDTSIHDGVMAEQAASNDNAHTDKGK